MKFFLLACALAFGSETALSSKTALFNGNDLLLRGNVYLDHPLGKMWASSANLIDYQTRKELPFARVDLSSDVRLLFHEGAELTCDKAAIETEEATGSVLGNVSFRDRVNGEPLTLLSSRVDFAAPGEIVTRVNASGGTEATFGDGYSLLCDTASYMREKARTLDANPRPGELCALFRGSDIVEGTAIHVDLTASTLTVDKSVGKLSSLRSPLRFAANTLHWDDKSDTLRLENEIWITSPEGNLRADKRVSLEQEVRCGKRETTRLWAEGRTLFTTGLYTLVAASALDVNRDHGTVTAYPAELTTDTAIIIADRADLTYRPDETIESMRFTGNVYVRTKEPDTPLRRALCHTLTYDPDTGHMTLSAKRDDNVLYWDEKEKTQMSAPAIHIDWPQNGAPKVRGTGAVRFTFNDEEKTRWFSKQKN